ncbi:MAG: crotonase/enoyl-CoA hydratase family protein [Candidatus Deferrimicrobiaceae bacterium]
MNVQVPVLKPLVYKQMETRFDVGCGALWCFMDPKPRPCFNSELLENIHKFAHSIRMMNQAGVHSKKEDTIRYSVLASNNPDVFSFGGDLDLFLRLYEEKDREGLRRYARSCVDIVHGASVGFDLPVTTISLVQGDALGGGFEAALCNNVVVAEKRARFGLPEILFNLFPGMGAYNLLAQRMDPPRAEKIILSGKVYSAEALFQMGVVDILAENGEGEKAVYEYISRHSRRWNAHQSLFKIRNRVRPISHEELVDVAEIWVDAVFNLDVRDIRIMERVLKSQNSLANGSAVSEGVGQVFA